jgi:hypothetical protein
MSIDEEKRYNVKGRKFPQSLERDVYSGTGCFQNIKHTKSKKKLSKTYYS